MGEELVAAGGFDAGDFLSVAGDVGAGGDVVEAEALNHRFTVVVVDGGRVANVDGARFGRLVDDGRGDEVDRVDDHRQEEEPSQVFARGVFGWIHGSRLEGGMKRKFVSQNY